MAGKHGPRRIFTQRRFRPSLATGKTQGERAKIGELRERVGDGRGDAVAAQGSPEWLGCVGKIARMTRSEREQSRGVGVLPIVFRNTVGSPCRR
jgi:hypothetical protein